MHTTTQTASRRRARSLKREADRHLCAVKDIVARGLARDPPGLTRTESDDCNRHFDEFDRLNELVEADSE